MFWKDLLKNNNELGKEMEQFLKNCAAWLEGYIEAFQSSSFSTPGINARKAELESIKVENKFKFILACHIFSVCVSNYLVNKRLNSEGN